MAPRKRTPVVPVPTSFERRYKQELDRRIQRAERLVLAAVMPVARQILAEPTAPPVRNDSASDAEAVIVQIAAAKIQIEQIFTERDATQLALSIFGDTSAYGLQGVKRQFQYTLGINPVLTEPYLDRAMQVFAAENASLITSIPTQTLGQVEDVVRNAILAGTRPEQLQSLIQARFNVASSRASLIARDQVGKLHGQLNQLRQTELGITSYFWQTSNDERVRDSHWVLASERFLWSNPPPDTGHPGEDYQCRCTALPDFTGFRGA